MQGYLAPEKTPPWFDAIPRSKRGWPKRLEEENRRVQAIGAPALSRLSFCARSSREPKGVIIQVRDRDQRPHMPGQGAVFFASRLQIPLAEHSVNG
jgi:hypothetical protein